MAKFVPNTPKPRKLTPEQERQEHYRKMAADRVKVNPFVPHVDLFKLDQYHARPL